MRFADTKRTYGLDLNADPIYVPEGFEVIEHIQGGLLHWNSQRPKIELYLTPSQRKGVVQGEKVYEELEEFDGVPANANALDFFINSLPNKPWIVPNEWKKVELHTEKYILFWGTRYRYEGGICVRSMCWCADARVQEWKSGYCWVDNLLNSQYPAAMIRKSEIKG